MAEPRVLLAGDQIAGAVRRLASDIARDYQARAPLCIGVLKGAFVFTADLVRSMELEVRVDFVSLSSYGSGTVSRGTVELVHGLWQDVTGQDVLIIEGVVDSGRTAWLLQAYLGERAPASLRLCTLLDKPARRQAPVTPDYVGFRIPDLFVVGYGLDWHEQYRHLPEICLLEPGGGEA